MRIQMYGPGSEKLTNEQLELLELEPGVSTAEVQAKSAREPVPVRAGEKRVRQHPGRQTLDGWVMRVGELLVPLAEVLRQELLRGSYLQADETPVGVQMHDGNGSNHLAYLWQYGRPHGAVVFDFRMGRGREGPKRFLGNFDGLLQSDGYAVYDSVGGPKMVHAARWSHYPESSIIQSVATEAHQNARMMCGCRDNGSNFSCVSSSKSS